MDCTFRLGMDYEIKETIFMHYACDCDVAQLVNVLVSVIPNLTFRLQHSNFQH